MQKVDKSSSNRIKEISSNKTLGESSLEFKISGSAIDYIIVNTLRRTILAEIPIIAFNKFKIEKNTAIFHNDYLKLRLQHLPVWSVENDVEMIDEKMKANNEEIKKEEEEEYDDVELEVDKSYNTSSLKQLTMYVNFKNKGNEIVTVTTNDAKFYYDEKQIVSPYKMAIPLIKLQPGQEISFSAITDIGTEQDNSMYSAVCICSYKQINENDFDFLLESRGQLTEKRILEVALVNITNRLKNFLKMIKETVTENDNVEGMIVVNNEDHTLGNLISRGMQMHKKILFAGYNLPHPRVNKVHFHYKHEKGADIIKIIEDVTDYYIEIFNMIKKNVEKEL
jgi:DNA-directed RNA polymerase subunit L